LEHLLDIQIFEGYYAKTVYKATADLVEACLKGALCF